MLFCGQEDISLPLYCLLINKLWWLAYLHILIAFFIHVVFFHFRIFCWLHCYALLHSPTQISSCLEDYATLESYFLPLPGIYDTIAVGKLTALLLFHWQKTHFRFDISSRCVINPSCNNVKEGFLKKKNWSKKKIAVHVVDVCLKHLRCRIWRREKFRNECKFHPINSVQLEEVEWEPFLSVQLLSGVTELWQGAQWIDK